MNKRERVQKEGKKDGGLLLSGRMFLPGPVGIAVTAVTSAIQYGLYAKPPACDGKGCFWQELRLYFEYRLVAGTVYILLFSSRALPMRKIGRAHV